MPKTQIKKVDEITTLRINRLSGRMLRLPSRLHKREILLLYDTSMKLEDVQKLAKKLTRCGSVTAVDMPGLGGMHDFYKIKSKPTIDNYAAYLAAFTTLRYKNKKFAVVGIGFGGTCATRMMQNHSLIAQQVTNVVLFGTMLAKHDLNYNHVSRLLLRLAYVTLSSRPLSLVLKMLHKNRTQYFIQKELLGLTIPSIRVNCPTYALAINVPKIFDPATWQQHVKVIFADCKIARSRKKYYVEPEALFEELPAEIRKNLRQ